MTLRPLRGRSLSPILDLQHVIPVDAVSEAIGITLWILIKSDKQNTYYPTVGTIRTFGSTTRSRIDVIRATAHSRVCSCSLRCPGTCRK